jgi:small GTP-binding protein
MDEKSDTSMAEAIIVLGSDRLRVRRRALITCGLFENDPTLLASPYQVRSSVSLNALRTFLDLVQGSEIELPTAIMSDIAALCSEFDFTFQGGREPLFSVDSPVLDFEIQNRLVALEEQVLNHDRRLSTHRAESERIAELENSLSHLKRDFLRLSSEFENLQRLVESMETGFVSTVQALREQVFSELSHLRSPQSGGSDTGGGFSFFKRKAKNDPPPKSPDPPTAARPQPIPFDDRIDLSASPIKLRIVGNTMVGKTVLVNFFTRGDASTYDTKPTVGASLNRGCVSARGKSVAVELWDSSGQESYYSILQIYARGAKGFLIVYQVNYRDSFGSVPKWVERMRKMTTPGIPILIVAWDTKLGEAQVSESEGRALAESLNACFVEMYAKQAVIQKGIGDFLEAVSS